MKPKNYIKPLNILITAILLVFSCQSVFSQTNLVTQWQDNYGGSQDDTLTNGCKTPDGGCILVGSTFSNDYDVSGNHGERDIWVVRLDAMGVKLWQKCIGGSQDDEGFCISEVSDGNYIIAGTSQTNYIYEGILIKISLSGEIIWQRIFNDNSHNYIYCVKETSDGGFICAGSIEHYINQIHSLETLLRKVNSSGVTVWTRTFAENGEANSECTDLVITDDNKYILCGNRDTDPSSSTTTNVYLMKTDEQGNQLWQRNFQNGPIIAKKLLKFSTGYWIIGESVYDDYGNLGLIISTNLDGTLNWLKDYDNLNYEYSNFSGALILPNGEIIVTGTALLNGNNDFDFLKLTLNNLGNIMSQDVFSYDNEDVNAIPILTFNNDILLAGTSNDVNYGRTFRHGDFYVVKECIPSTLNISCENTTFCISTTLSATSGFADYQWNTGQTSSSITVSNSGTYSVNCHNVYGCPSQAQLSVTKIETFNNPQICMVTFNPSTGKNVLIHQKENNTRVDSLFVYRRENQSDPFIKIGGMSYYHSPSFPDNSSNANFKSYQYCITVRDSSCSQESDLSPLHKTLLLQASIEGSQVLLNWTPYTGFNYAKFELYRATGINDFIHIADIPSNSFVFTDMNPPSGEKRYQIRISKPDPCGSNPAIYEVVSNIINTTILGLTEQHQGNLSIYPNPAGEVTCIRDDQNRDNSITYSYTIFSPEGKEILSGTTYSCIELNSLKRGNYLLGVENRMFKLVKE